MTLGAYEYAVLGESMTQEKAAALCKKVVGGDLASITSAADNSKLYDLVVELDKAIGASGSRELHIAAST